MEAFQAVEGEYTGEKLPLEGTLGFYTLQTIYMHIITLNKNTTQ